MLFNIHIDGFTHLENYLSAAEQTTLWAVCHDVFEKQPLWRPEFVYGRDQNQKPLVTPYALENSNCGKFAWLSDAAGIGYSATTRDGRNWMAIPAEIMAVVEKLKESNHIPRSFTAENCLINKYQNQKDEQNRLKPSRLGIHRDKSEKNLAPPVVSISLGLAAVFQIGGLRRADALGEVLVTSGDVIILGGGEHGGGARNAYHGVKCVIPNTAPSFLPATDYRLNITIRQVE